MGLSDRVSTTPSLHPIAQLSGGVDDRLFGTRPPSTRFHLSRTCGKFSRVHRGKYKVKLTGDSALLQLPFEALVKSLEINSQGVNEALSHSWFRTSFVSRGQRKPSVAVPC